MHAILLIQRLCDTLADVCKLGQDTRCKPRCAWSLIILYVSSPRYVSKGTCSRNEDSKTYLTVILASWNVTSDWDCNPKNTSKVVSIWDFFRWGNESLMPRPEHLWHTQLHWACNPWCNDTRCFLIKVAKSTSNSPRSTFTLGSSCGKTRRFFACASNSKSGNTSMVVPFSRLRLLMRIAELDSAYRPWFKPWSMRRTAWSFGFGVV